MRLPVNSSISRKSKLVKRLRYLWTWELFDSFFLPALAIIIARVAKSPLGLFTIYSTALVALILWQGTAYWWLKLQAIKTDSRISSKHLRWFSVLKKVNWGLIGLLPLLLVLKVLAGNASSSSLDVIAGLGFYGLALLEQINYYHYQLMYDYPPDWRRLVEEKKLKRSSLNRALTKWEEGK
jgi:hypothetical protein